MFVVDIVSWLSGSCKRRGCLVFKSVVGGGAACFVGRAQLAKLKVQALRRGVWFKALRRIDRVLLDLTIKVADVVRSSLLASSIAELVRRLECAMESRVCRAVREVGFALARSLSLVAVKLGYAAAGRWAFDRAFAVYLAVMHLNSGRASSA
jgi:hypothetical protein